MILHYQNNKNFKKRELFESDIIKNFETSKIFQLTLFFHSTINTKTEIGLLSLVKKFFDTLPLLHDIKILISNIEILIYFKFQKFICSK